MILYDGRFIWEIKYLHSNTKHNNIKKLKQKKR